MTEEDFKKYNGLGGDVFGDVVALDETDNTLYTRDGIRLCVYVFRGVALNLADIQRNLAQFD